MEKTHCEATEINLLTGQHIAELRDLNLEQVQGMDGPRREALSASIAAAPS